MIGDQRSRQTHLETTRRHAVSDGFDMSELLKQAQDMQAQLADAQAAAADTEVVGSAGAGAVTVTMTVGGEIRRVNISPDVVNVDDVEILEGLVQLAFTDAMGQCSQIQSQAMGGLGEALGGLGGLLG
jgi:hypothetical protein